MKRNYEYASVEELRKEVKTYLDECDYNYIPDAVELPYQNSDKNDAFLDRFVEELKSSPLNREECMLILECKNFIELAREVLYDCPDINMFSFMEIVFDYAREALLYDRSRYY